MIFFVYTDKSELTFANFGICTCIIVSASHIIAYTIPALSMDLSQRFPVLSRTIPIFQDFPGPGNFTKKNPGLFRRRENHVSWAVNPPVCCYHPYPPPPFNSITLQGQHSLNSLIVFYLYYLRHRDGVGNTTQENTQRSLSL